MYIVQYQNAKSNGWVFTGREFSLTEREIAFDSLKGARHRFPDNQWRLAWVELTIIEEDI